jgi:hypothetical protein
MSFPITIKSSLTNAVSRKLKSIHGKQQPITVLGLCVADSTLDRIKPSRTSFTALLGKDFDDFFGKTFEMLWRGAIENILRAQRGELNL